MKPVGQARAVPYRIASVVLQKCARARASSPTINQFHLAVVFAPSSYSSLVLADLSAAPAPFDDVMMDDSHSDASSITSFGAPVVMPTRGDLDKYGIHIYCPKRL